MGGVDRPSTRQLELLALHSSGMTSAEVAKAVHLSKWTVNLELNTLRARLGARSLYQAQVLALAEGLLELDGRDRRLFVPDRVAAEV